MTLLLNDIIEKPEVITSSDYLSHLNQHILFCPLLSTDERERFRINHKIELNNNNTARLSLCITDNYQNRYLGSYLIKKTIDIGRQIGKCQLILSGGVLVENTRAIRFFEKNQFELFSLNSTYSFEPCASMLFV